MNVVTLHRSRRAVVVLAARAVLLPVGVAVLGQNLATIHQWSPRTWAVSVAVALCAVAAFVELVRSFATTDLTIVDGDLVLRSPTLLRRPVRIARHQILDARVTPHGWFDYSGRLPYSARDTGVITSDRPDLGASIRAVVTLDAPVALPWLRIPTPFGDLTRGRGMPRAARRLVLSMATRDVAVVQALWCDLPQADTVSTRATGATRAARVCAPPRCFSGLHSDRARRRGGGRIRRAASCNARSTARAAARRVPRRARHDGADRPDGRVVLVAAHGRSRRDDE